jgi:hypothetical protein
MGNPKIGFILAIAFHSPSNTQVAATVAPVQDPK